MSRANRRLRTPANWFLNPIELVDYTRLVADEVASGRYPYVKYDESDRWHQRLYRDQRVDLWLISWLPSQGTQLHDHGGSAGAFTVLSGTLTEAVYRAGSAGEPLRDVAHGPSASVGFGARYVHDVRNVSDEPAVSVHAYSRPLTTMNFYDIDGAGALTRIATVATEDPEPMVELPASGHPAA
jgi:predicted metal-dependent enzyme (double-stranded beta helix superfamily)